MIKWGFIGCGDVVEHKSGKPFWKEQDSEVVAVMCRNIDRAKAFAKKYGIENYYDDVSELLKNPEVDAVYIATTPDSHMTLAKQAIAAKKAVYVEKPMGINALECEQVLEYAKEQNVPLYVAYYRRALPYFQTIKKLVDDGEIGQIRSVNIVHYGKKPSSDELVWRRDPKIAGGGLFHDLGCHTLDILDYIISPIAQVCGMHDNQRALFESEDTFSASFLFENGVIGTGLWCFDVSDKLEKVQIIGNEGRIEFSVYGNVLEVIKNGEISRTEFTHPKFIQQPMIYNVIASLQGKEQALSTGETAIRTTKIIDEITK